MDRGLAGVACVTIVAAAMTSAVSCGDPWQPPEAPVAPVVIPPLGSSAPAPEPRPTAPPDDPVESMHETEPSAAPIAPPQATGPAFDRGAAAAALSAVDVQACKRLGGATGYGHVTVTFQLDGSVSSAVVDSGPFPGTPEGGCIAGQFRRARVPPFSGTPVRVGKPFAMK